MNPTPRTPREILLARHADAARPALDAQRDALLARFTTASDTHATTAPAGSHRADPRSPFAFFATLHRELFAPYRRAWSTLACAWLAVLALQQINHFATPRLAPARMASSAPADDATLFALWLEQRRQLAALAADTGLRSWPVSPGFIREKTPPAPASHPLGSLELAPARLALA